MLFFESHGRSPLNIDIHSNGLCPRVLVLDAELMMVIGSDRHNGAVRRRVVKSEKNRDPDKKGFAVRITVDRGEDLDGRRLALVPSRGRHAGALKSCSRRHGWQTGSATRRSSRASFNAAAYSKRDRWKAVPSSVPVGSRRLPSATGPRYRTGGPEADVIAATGNIGSALAAERHHVMGETR
jgi:hypothetical protein